MDYLYYFRLKANTRDHLQGRSVLLDHVLKEGRNNNSLKDDWRQTKEMVVGWPWAAHSPAPALHHWRHQAGLAQQAGQQVGECGVHLSHP